MTVSDIRRNRPAYRFVTPRLEGLEDRCLLASKAASVITIKETPNPSNLVAPGTTLLTFIGTKNNDVISLNDNGTGSAGNIFVSYGSAGDYVSKGAVSEILVETGTGKDQVTYELDGNLQPKVIEFIEVGSNAAKGGGSVQLTANIVGEVLDQSTLEILGVPDRQKTTTMNVNDSGEIDGNLTAGITTLGSNSKLGGPKVFRFSSTAAIGPNGDIDTGLTGSRRNDIANVSYSGTNDGELDIAEVGNGGNDQLSADVSMIPGSTGSVGSHNNRSFLQSSGRKDRLRFTIHQGTDSTTTSNIFADLIDTSKKDISTHTGNVTPFTKGPDSIVF
jgi:hypothetical protein